MWQGLAVYFVVVGLRVLLNYRSLRNYLKLPLVERPAPAEHLPTVSVIVPARNEAHNLPALLDSLKALEYPSVQIIVVDDGSSDGTAAIAREHGAHVEHVDGPPEDWLGKPFACWTGAQQAAGEWLLFTDADTIHRSESLDRAMRFALQHKAQAVSLFLQQSCLHFWECVVLPFVFQQYFIGLPYQRVNEPGAPDALANGQYILIERGAYFRAGGHEAVKSAVLEDVALATRLKASGVPLLTARGERLASVRMYRGLREMCAGIGKSAHHYVRQRGWRAGPSVLGGLLSLLALPCAVYGLATSSRAFELAAVVTYVTSVAELSLWQFLFGTPLSYAVFQPLAAVVVFAVGLDGMIRRKHLWKGRRV